MAASPREKPPSEGHLRALLRASPLIPPELRAHWLRVLPYLTDEQRARLAALLAAGPAPEGAPTSPSADGPHA